MPEIQEITDPRHPAYQDDEKGYRAMAPTDIPTMSLVGPCYGGILREEYKTESLPGLRFLYTFEVKAIVSMSEGFTLRRRTRRSNDAAKIVRADQTIRDRGSGRTQMSALQGEDKENMRLGRKAAVPIPRKGEPREGKVASDESTQEKLLVLDSTSSDETECGYDDTESECEGEGEVKLISGVPMRKGRKVCETDESLFDIDASEIRNELSMINDPRGIEQVYKYKPHESHEPNLKVRSYTTWLMHLVNKSTSNIMQLSFTHL